MQKIVYLKPPEVFSPKMEVVSCFCQVGDKILFLKRNYGKPYGGTWGLPAGKLEQGEDSYTGVIREVFEETAILLHKKDLVFLKRVYVAYPEIDFAYYMFRSMLKDYPKNLCLNKEHIKFKWVTAKEALKLHLIPGESECIKLVYKL